MLDFVQVVAKPVKVNRTETIEIRPKFIMKKTSDLMIRGGDFYAVWVEERGLWSTDEDDVITCIDKALAEEAKRWIDRYPDLEVKYMYDADSGSIDRWHKYCQKQRRDSFVMLDETLIFSNMKAKKEDYASKRLDYPLEKGDISAWDKLIGTLYEPDERHKIEWAIGSIVSGESKNLQKFMVLYGAAGTGKSTILNVIQQLFKGYYSVFDAKALGSSSNSFALESFRTNPLVAIQHDGDLSRIEDNTRLNSLVSHERMPVNTKFEKVYENSFKAFLFMGTNKPVKITDGKSGLLRRLIDVHPSGNKLDATDYRRTVEQVGFELGAIACHCKEVYLADPNYYDDYIPSEMMGATNDFYNFIIDSYHVFKREDGTTLKAAWEMYKTYCEDAKVPFPFSRRNFKEELKNYFRDFEESFLFDDGSKVRSYYHGFRTDKFESEKTPGGENQKNKTSWLVMSEPRGPSPLNEYLADYPAQYASMAEKPVQAWDKVKTTLSDIDTSKLHYSLGPECLVTIDFDLKDESGNKSFERNLEAASKWPPTYAELSKGGQGIHLEYIYTGDVSRLNRVFDDDIEIKIFTGKSSLRRRLSKCNDLPIATISSGLPLKEDDKVINWDGVQNEKAIRTMIKKNLNKEYHNYTKPSVDYIYKILEDAYNNGVKYDVTDLRNAVFAFAACSSNQADACLKLVNRMHFKSDEPSKPVNDNNASLIFYDIEVFPNLFLVNWKIAGLGKPVVRMINPTPRDIEELLKFRLVGFNCRRYDNHILYARLMGYTNEQLYNLSQSIINSKKGENRCCFFGEAYNISYTDVYDFASAGNKKSLKKLEIEIAGISEAKLQKKGFSEEEIRIIKAGGHHKELGLPWDKPVPEELWEKVAEYCDQDVISTEAVFVYLKGDWTARRILADISGMTVNDTTNSLSTRIIFGNNKKPQGEFNYRNLAEPVGSERYEEYRIKFGEDYKFRVFDADGMPKYCDYIPGTKLPDGWSILPFFPDYTHAMGVSKYLGQVIGEGGRVYSEPGMYGNVWDGDVTGMHPSTIAAEVLFGPRYTPAYNAIVDGRVSIKHQAWSDIDELFDGKLKPFIQGVIDGKLTVKDLANALKTVVNSVYGLTSASFDNPFRDIRNKDNIVAKRGALFMTLLTSEVQKRGFTVAHNKTDSIKIPDATPEIIDFVVKFGKEYGYSFETEAEFEKFCLVNDAVYIAKTKDGEWTATGKQFAVPYVFKKLFSGEDIVFDDMCETFAVSKGALYLDMNEPLPDVSEEEKRLEKALKREAPNENEIEELRAQISRGHDYRFVGKVGQFCPIKPGRGGGQLYRMNDDKYYAAPGSTGFRWLESELIRDSGEDAIDRSYYDKLVNEAIETISKFGDFEWFVSDDPYIPKDPVPDFMKIPEDAPVELPFL